MISCSNNSGLIPPQLVRPLLHKLTGGNANGASGTWQARGRADEGQAAVRTVDLIRAHHAIASVDVIEIVAVGRNRQVNRLRRKWGGYGADQAEAAVRGNAIAADGAAGVVSGVGKARIGRDGNPARSCLSVGNGTANGRQVAVWFDKVGRGGA